MVIWDGRRLMFPVRQEYVTTPRSKINDSSGFDFCIYRQSLRRHVGAGKAVFFQSFHRQTRAQEVIQLKHFPQHDLHNWHTMLTNTNPCGKSLGVLSVVPTLQHGINLWTSTVETRSFALKCSQCGVRGKILPHSVFLGQTSFHNVIQRSEHPTGSLRGVRARCFGDCN